MAIAPVAGRRFGRIAWSVARRSFATAVPGGDFEVGEVGGIKYAALQHDGRGASAITVTLKAGPRYEPSRGVAHLLKNATFKRSQKRSYLRIARETEILGGVLSTGMDREHIYLTAEFAKGDEPFFAEVLGDALLLSPLVQHEYLEQAVPSALNEVKQVEALPEVAILEAAFDAAYRRGLGNSMFIDKRRHVDYGLVADYFAQRISDPSNFAVTAINVPSGVLKDLIIEYFSAGSSGISMPHGTMQRAEEKTPQSAASTPASAATSSLTPAVEHSPSEVFGGERRINNSSGSRQGSYLLAFESRPINDPVTPVLAALLDPATKVKYGKSSGLLTAAVNGMQAQIRAVNYAFSDSGLFTVQVDGAIEELPSVISQALDIMGKTGEKLGKDELDRAKNQAKLAWSEAFDRRSGLEVMGQHLLSGGFTSIGQAIDAIDKVTAKQVSELAIDCLQSPQTLVAAGPIELMPYADEILPSGGSAEKASKATDGSKAAGKKRAAQKM